MTRASTLILSAVVWSACGAPGTRPSSASEASRPVAQFPSRHRVAAALELGEPPDLADLIVAESVHVERWAITSTPAPADLVYEPEGVFEPLLDAAVAAEGATITRSAGLRCAAQETARFFAEHGAWPTDELTSFLLAACGSSVVDVAQAGTRGTIDPRATDAQLLEEASAPMQAALAPAVQDGRTMGLGFARVGNHVALVALSAAPLMRVDPSDGPGADGLVIVRGELRGEGADIVVGSVNQGLRGVARCHVTSGIRLPEVELRCPLHEDDATTLLHIRTATVGRVLSRHVATVLLRRTPSAMPSFEAQSAGAPAIVTDSAMAGPLVVERLNAARAEAGLGPVRLAAPQSAVNAQIAPHLAGTRDRDAADVLGLGVIAGWAIEDGVIRWGDMLGQVSRGGVDVARWLGAALATPSGRYVLYREDATQVAVGAVPVVEREGLGLVVSTFSFYDGVDHAAAAERLFQRISQARNDRGLPPPRRLEGLSRLEARAAAVARGQEAAYPAFQAGLNEESQRAGRSMRGLVFETLDLEAGQLPEPLFEARELQLGLAVGHTRAPGAAWGQWVVFLVFR